MSAATSAGSAPSRHCAASDCVSAMPSSAPVGWSRNAKPNVREVAYRLIPYLSGGLLVFLLVVFAYALAEDLQVMGRWMDRPYLFVFPVIGAMAAVVLAV